MGSSGCGGALLKILGEVQLRPVVVGHVECDMGHQMNVEFTMALRYNSINEQINYKPIEEPHFKALLGRVVSEITIETPVDGNCILHHSHTSLYRALAYAICLE